MNLSMRLTHILPILLGCALAGCIDTNYDLSDVDTTARVDVDNLVLPINIDPIQLQSMIHIKDNSKIQIVDGQYAVIVDGQFGSSDIVVNPVNIAAPTVNAISTTIPNYETNSSAATFVIAQSLLSSFNYESSNVSQSIASLERIATDWTIKLQISVDEGGNIVKRFELRNFVLQLPKGLEGQPDQGTYDSETGLITIQNSVSADKTITITMPVTAVDIAKSDLQYDYSSHTIKLADQIGVKYGDIYASELSSATDLASISIVVKPILSAIKITSFTGNLSYDIQGFDIPQVDLSELPGIFSQSNTNISIVNPQLYLSINNPLSSYNVSAVTGMELKPMRDGVIDKTYSPDNGDINVGVNDNSGAYNLLLSPTIPSSYYQGYGTPNYQKFTSLSDILEGNGLPTSILVDMVNPRIQSSHVSDLVLGNLGTVSGRYTFYAPLQLGNSSTITYSGTESGWNSEDLENLTITKMTITAEMSNNLPVNLKLDIYPLDKDGNVINNVTITGAEVNGSTEQTLKVNLEGVIKNLDGIEYSAKVNVADSEALAPDLQITLKNVKATITGYYTREL